jgi:ABC-type branched-subunit amino acid transport system ATPase component
MSMPATASRLEIRNLAAGYVPSHPVLRGVTMTAEPNRITVVLGPNGAGKSTALRVAAGHLKPQAGSVLLDGVDIGELPAHRRAQRGIALLPQGRSTFPELLVDQDIRAAIKIADYVYVLSSGKNDMEGERSAFEGDLGVMVRGWLGV